MQKEGMGGIANNVVVGVLPTLGGDHLSGELIVRLPQVEIGTDIFRVADFFEADFSKFSDLKVVERDKRNAEDAV